MVTLTPAAVVAHAETRATEGKAPCLFFLGIEDAKESLESALRYLNPQELLPDYACTDCGARVVKLWRLAMDTTLRCARCITGQDIEVSTARQLCGQVPAILSKFGDMYWGHGSVPDVLIDWWLDLPTANTERK